MDQTSAENNNLDPFVLPIRSIASAGYPTVVWMVKGDAGGWLMIFPD
jgi:hypothetical protein